MSAMDGGVSALTETQSVRLQTWLALELAFCVNELNMAEYRNVTNLPRLLETLDSQYTKHNRKIEFCADCIKIDYTRMGKLQEAAQRIAEAKKQLEGEADKILAKVDGLTAKAPAAFAHGHAILDQQNADVDAMVSELGQISNLPLDK